MLSEIIGDYAKFLDEILVEIEAAGIDLADFSQIDHLCYRTVSASNYESKKQELSSVGWLLGENIINHRPIAAFRLKQPIIHDKWRIDTVELPAPKPGNQFSEGLEHIELVIYDDIPSFLKKYQNLQFDLRAVERGINPEIGLKLNKYSVKFHLLNLPTVVYLEEKLGIKEVSDPPSQPKL